MTDNYTNSELNQTEASTFATESSTPALDRTEIIERLNSAYLPALYEQLLKVGRGNNLAAQEGMQQWLRGQQVDVTIVRQDNTTAFVVHDRVKEQINVSFSASDETRDIVDNANFFPTKSAIGGDVHQGFNNAAHRVMDDVKAAVQRYAATTGDKRTDINLSGFSQGGSAAVITASDWIGNGFLENNPKLRLRSISTFGSPPSGDSEFIDALERNAAISNIKLTRVVVEGDPVPSMMAKDGPWWIPEIYDHMKNTFYLDASGNISAKPDKDALKGTTKDWSTHDPLYYMDKLNSPQIARSNTSAVVEYGIKDGLQTDTLLLRRDFTSVSNSTDASSTKPAPLSSRDKATSHPQQISPDPNSPAVPFL